MSTYRPRKRFGQHFLHDAGTVQRIIDVFAPQPDDRIVEIGPGHGALTQPLLERVHTLDAVELDRDLVSKLASAYPPERLRLHQADALDFPLCDLPGSGERLRVIGNLPYNISTPLLFRLLDQARCIRDMMLMVQKEVAERITARPGGGDYGRLSVMVQWRCRVEKLFDVPPAAFSPPPKVDSMVIRLIPYETPPVVVSDPQRFAQVVQQAFAQRRKTLRNALGTLIETEAMRAAGIDPGRRAQTLDIAEFARLAEIAGHRPLGVR